MLRLGMGGGGSLHDGGNTGGYAMALEEAGMRDCIVCLRQDGWDGGVEE